MLKGADTWEDAAALCEKRGQRLASLHTFHLNDGMLQLLTRLVKEGDSTVFVGLRTPVPLLNTHL